MHVHALGRNDGFTYLEASLVLALLLLVFATAMPRLFNATAEGDYTRSTAQDIIGLLNTAQATAVANKLNDHWGIHLVDNGTTDCGITTSNDCVVFYKGTSFASRDSSYDEPYVFHWNNQFGNVDDPDFYFQRFSGYAKGLLNGDTTKIKVTDGTNTTTILLLSNGTAYSIGNSN